MSKVDYGDDLGYAGTRIRGSVLKTADGKRVVYVHSLDYDEEDGQFLCTDNLTGDSVRYYLEELDMSPVELGYINLEDRCSFVSRMPARHYKQGLTSQTFPQTGYPGASIDSYEVANCILGRYPSLSDSLEQVICGESRSLAFSRNFAVCGDEAKLLFRDKFVGEVHHSQANNLVHARLNPEFKFLQEMLEDETAIQ